MNGLQGNLCYHLKSKTEVSDILGNIVIFANNSQGNQSFTLNLLLPNLQKNEEIYNFNPCL